MNADLKDAFSRIKPVCDVLMVCPTSESIGRFVVHVSELKKEVVQELQQYLLFPLITHLESEEADKKYELQKKLVDAMRLVLEKIVVNSFEMCMKMEVGLLQLVFDHTNNGMIAESPEELKRSVMQCLTILQLKVDRKYREAMLKAHVPLLGKAIYVSVHIAKLEKLRTLRLAAINCVTAHTACHPKLTKNYYISDPVIEKLVIDMLSLILPGVLGALQDVANCTENPGHALVVAALDAIHRILCLAMHNKYMSQSSELKSEDFAKLYMEKQNSEVSKVDPKSVPVRSPEWFALAGEKLLLITESIVSLRTHEHFKVRKELAVYCARLLTDCNKSMHSSVPLALDVLISLSKDSYVEVSQYSACAVNLHFARTPHCDVTLHALCDNLFATLTELPRVINNIDSGQKLSSLNLLLGYLEVLASVSSRGACRLTRALSGCERLTCVCAALQAAAAMQPTGSLLQQHAVRDVSSPPPPGSPWCSLRQLDPQCERSLHAVLTALGDADCAELVVDRLIDMFEQSRECELVYIVNWMVSAPKSSENLIKTILNLYIEESVWYLPLEVGHSEASLSDSDTLDVTVYDPRAWHTDTVPGLYEGAVSTRYTDISSRSPRPAARVSRDSCATVRDAQRNMLLCCLLTEGVGMMARRLMDKFQPYLLKTLCLVLERVGSKYEMLHLAGLKAIHDISFACGHSCVMDLIKSNADYFTNQITARLKKAWNCQSALQILSVVMEYSDSSILNYLYGIVQDVLVQSCDKYYENDLYAYLQVFLSFVECILKWYTAEQTPSTCETKTIDVLQDLRMFIQNKEVEEKLLSGQEFEQETGKSVEEMYREDMKKREEDLLEYDDAVTEEKPPPPQYITVTVTILRRCLNYIVSSQRDNTIIALQILNKGLPLLKGYQNELLPLVHSCWAPLVAAFEKEPAVMKRAFELLVTMAELAKDFIRSRAVKEVLPQIFTFLHKSSSDSYLKDVGAAYRNSQAYELQSIALQSLPRLAADLMLEDDALQRALACVDPYLSKKQPKRLQTAAVEFFKRMLDYDYGATWYHLRELCNNDQVLSPPTDVSNLQIITGTPYAPTDKDYENNIKLIFDFIVT